MNRLKIPTEHQARYYRKIWLELFDGGSDQWLWVVRDGLTYIFLEVIDLPAYCGRDATSRWCASVDTVDLATASPDTIATALQCCGYQEELDFRKEGDRLAIAEMLWSYGAKSPMWSDDAGKVTFDSYGNCEQDYGDGDPAFRSLRKRAREAAEELFDEDTREHQLDTKIVNAIGQTAREFANATDGLWTALRRIKDDPQATSEQKLVLGMYQKAKTTLGAGPVPSDLQSEDHGER